MNIRFYAAIPTNDQKLKVRYLSPKCMSDGTIEEMDFVEMEDPDKVLRLLENFDLVENDFLKSFYADLEKATNVNVYGKNELPVNEISLVFQMNMFL